MFCHKLRCALSDYAEERGGSSGNAALTAPFLLSFVVNFMYM